MSIGFLDMESGVFLDTESMEVLDTSVTAGLIPQINRVFLPAAKDRSEEYTSQTFASALATELPPIINSSHIVLVGQSFGGLSALRAALTASTETTPAIKGAIAQSPAVWWSADRSAELADTLSDGPAGGDIAAQLTGPSLENPAAHSGSGLARIVLTCGAEEPPMQRHVDAVADALTRRGFPTTNHRTPGGHDPAMWRHGIIPALAELLG
ncbi:alpha/beta hydrolase-fold protein [Corynebacterium minutissimum]